MSKISKKKYTSLKSILTYEGNYPEDYHLKDGHYIDKCQKCKKNFVGSKKRKFCKLCIEKEDNNL